MESSAVQSLIETDELAKLIESDADFKILNCSQSLAPEDGDSIINHHNKHIP